MITKLTYGLKHGKLVSILDVESGLACECICPACKGKLVARKGDIRVHHFAHHHEENCEHGVETALHLAAKEIIEEKKIFTIPPLDVAEELSEYVYGPDIRLSNSKKLEIDEVHLEVDLADFKPDIIAKIKNKYLIIEIAVTHFVDESKLEKIKNRGISTVEVDLRHLKDGYTKKDLTKAVIRNVKNKYWIFNARQEDLLEQYRHEKEQELKLKHDHLALLKQEELNRQKERNKKKYNALKYGYDIIKYINGTNINCPKIIKEQAWSMTYNEVISDLRKGKLWNGIIYGQGPNGKYIFIDNKKFEIFPKDSEFRLVGEKRKIRNRIFGQLSVISEKSRLSPEKCEDCQYFQEYLDENLYSFSCSFRKENNLK